MPSFSSQEILGIVIAASFASGLNVYATVATLGLLSHAHVFDLPPSLHLLGSWGVIGVAGVLFVLEFFGDKVPAFDLVWNALHTFIRVPVAMLLSYGATQQLSPTAQLGATALAGLIALAAHSGKTAVRAAVTASPEPFSNIALSFGEDVAAISLTWFATTHPVLAAGIAVVGVIVVLLFLRFVIRSLSRLFRQAGSAMRSLFSAGLT
jgi:Domain of unknown function (DUF4126)